MNGLFGFLPGGKLDFTRKCSGFLALGVLFYFLAGFYVEGGHQRTLFYIFVALPALLLIGRLREIPRYPVVVLVLFLLFFSLSALWSGEWQSVFDAMKYSLLIIFLMLGVAELSRHGLFDRVPLLIAVAGGGAAVLFLVGGIYSGYGFSDFLSERLSMHELSGLGEDNPINSAVLLGLTAYAAWWLVPARGMSCKVVMVFIFLLCLFLMFVTKSRGPVLALGVTIALLGVLRKRKEDLLLVALCVGVSLFLFSIPDFRLSILNRISEPNYRLEIWREALSQGLGSWVWGQGFGRDAAISIDGGNSIVTHSHFFILELFRIGGLVGLGLFVLMVGFFVRGGINGQAFFLLWLLYGVICLSTNGRLVLIRPSVEWLAFWLPLFMFFFSARYRGRAGRL